MSDTLLLSSGTEGLQPLGTAAQRSYELLSATLRQRLGSEYATLLAEPVAAPQGDYIDWHAPVAGRVMRLADLEADAQSGLRVRLGQQIAAILAEAEALTSQPDADAQRLGEALANAIEIPSDDMIFVVRTAQGDRPVLAFWSWVGAERQAVRGVLTAMIPRAVPLDVVHSAPGARLWAHPVWWWLVLLGWLLLAGLLALILYLMVHPCGLAPLGPDHCRGEQAALSAAYSEEAALSDRIQRLQHEIALSNRACKPTVPIGPAVAPPAFPQPEQKGALPPEPFHEIRRLADLGAAPYTRPEPGEPGLRNADAEH